MLVLWQPLLALFLAGLIISGVTLARVGGWNIRRMAILVALFLALYSVTLFLSWRYLLALFLVSLIILGVVLTRVDGWKVGLMAVLLALYGVAIVLVLLWNEVCHPVSRVAIAEVNAVRLLIVLAVACLVTAASLVRRHAYAFALVCLAVPPVIWIPIAAIIHLLIPGESACAPSHIMWGGGWI